MIDRVPVAAARVAWEWAERATSTEQLLDLAEAAPCVRVRDGADVLCVTCCAKAVVVAALHGIADYGSHIAHARFILATTAGLLQIEPDLAADNVDEAVEQLPWREGLNLANQQATAKPAAAGWGVAS